MQAGNFAGSANYYSPSRTLLLHLSLEEGSAREKGLQLMLNELVFDELNPNIPKV